jgi:hypothetical protein
MVIGDGGCVVEVLIYKNLKDVRFLQNGETPVDSRTELKLVVALCGG